MPISVPAVPPTTGRTERARPHSLAMRSIEVDGQPLRGAVRPGTAAGVPLQLVSGIGASLELLQPFAERSIRRSM